MNGLAWIAITMVLATPGCAQIPVPRSNSESGPHPRPEACVVVAGRDPADCGHAGRDPTERHASSASAHPLPDTSELLDAAADAPTHCSTPRWPRQMPKPKPKQAKLLAESDATGLPSLSKIREADSKESAKDSEPDQSTSPNRQANQETHQGQPQTPPEPNAEPSADPKLVALRALTESSAPAKPTPVTIDPEKPLKPIDPREIWNEGVTRLRKIATEQARASSSGAWTLRGSSARCHRRG